MPFYTPLRYPGGKRRLLPAVAQLLGENRLSDVEYAEPYAGGAAIALGLLFEEHASRVHINDLSLAVFAFWHSVLNKADALCRRIEQTDVTIAEWHRQRLIYNNRNSADLCQLGFATLFLNRTNRSGIISGGVIGGQNQTGKWLLNARFNKRELILRIRRIARYRNRICLYRSDALEFIKGVIPTLGKRSFVFFDPPYIDNGEDLYLNDYEIEDHRRVAKFVQKLKQPWVVTYDRAAIREQLYPGKRRLLYDLSYSAQDRYGGGEVMFIASDLMLPADWRTSRKIRLSDPQNRYPLFARLQIPA